MDIVDRLNGGEILNINVCREAADEITRLRAELKGAKLVASLIKRQKALDAESARIIGENLWGLYDSAPNHPAPVVPEDKYRAMLAKKLDLIRCGVAVNYGSGSYEHPLYLEAANLLSAAKEPQC
jgi:hypothetical protein